jgi:hypothetical protein
MKENIPYFQCRRRFIVVIFNFYHFRALSRIDLLKEELDQINKRHAQHCVGFTNKLYLKQTDIFLNNNINNPSQANDESNIRSGVDYPELNTSNSKANEHAMTKPQQIKKTNEQKSAFYEFYLMLLLLKNYQALNSIGFCRILKKRDNIFQTKRGDEWR